MDSGERPIIAIVGSVRTEIVGTKHAAARSACKEFGAALAAGGWRLAVFASDKDDIEPDVVTGYVGAGSALDHSIVC
ncbi:MAG TPA: hypothetical protein VLL54_15015 [Pyrinomonadaceae bacterium]|nr:hypothetical protein [Pyrinomonadaceae bacterium]